MACGERNYSLTTSVRTEGQEGNWVGGVYLSRGRENLQVLEELRRQTEEWKIGPTINIFEEKKKYWITLSGETTWKGTSREKVGTGTWKKDSRGLLLRYVVKERQKLIPDSLTPGRV